MTWPGGARVLTHRGGASVTQPLLGVPRWISSIDRAEPPRVAAVVERRLRPRLVGGYDLHLRVADHRDRPPVRGDRGPWRRRVRDRGRADTRPRRNARLRAR